MIDFIYGMCEKCAIKYARVWSVRRTFFKACALFELVLEHEPETWHVRTCVFTNYFPIIAICTNIYSILLRTKYYHLFFSNLSLTICMCASEYEKRAKKRIQKPNGFSRRKKQWFPGKNGILFHKFFWPTARKNCSSDSEKCLRCKVEG